MASKPVPTEEQEVSEVLKKMGERFRQLRIQKGYTSQETFAYEKNINRVQYSRYEQGKDIRISTLVKVLKAFDMTVEEFFREGVQ